MPTIRMLDGSEPEPEPDELEANPFLEALSGLGIDASQQEQLVQAAASVSGEYAGHFKGQLDDPV